MIAWASLGGSFDLPAGEATPSRQAYIQAAGIRSGRLQYHDHDHAYAMAIMPFMVLTGPFCTWPWVLDEDIMRFQQTVRH